MGKAPAFQFYTGDHLKDPELSMCSLATQGAWVRLLCLMFEAKDRGMLTGRIAQIARAVGCSPDELADALIELSETGAAEVKVGDLRIHERYESVTPSVTDNEKVTVMSRRMMRDDKDRSNNALRQRRHREKRNSNEEVTPPSSTSSSTSVKNTPNGVQKKSACNAAEDNSNSPPESPQESPHEVRQEKATRQRFKPPTLAQVTAYCHERNNGIDPQHFIAHYEANGWKVGKNPMKNWKAAVVTWEKNQHGGRHHAPHQQRAGSSAADRTLDYHETLKRVANES